MNNFRSKIVNAVALAVVLPLLIVVYLMTQWASGALDNPTTIVILTLLALVLIAGGLNILRTAEIEFEQYIRDIEAKTKGAAGNEAAD